ncbi:MAG: C39 family peptidase [candidate division KSB1 bacterium]|nr:C39 family peptidase [candidate division KSB1 bacterium]
MKIKRCSRVILFILFLSFSLLDIISSGFTQSIPYPDQQFIIASGDSLIYYAEFISNIIQSDDGQRIQLIDGATTGYLILGPQYSRYPFNMGLPSWNGTAPGDSGAFRVLIRVPYTSGWSPWLDVGYWKTNFWPSKTTSFSGGQVDIDIVELYYYANQWQFAVEFKRKSATGTSPTLSLLSFFVSDTRTTQQIDYNAILDDKPAAIFIPTTFLAQYRISSEFGGSICSPTTVSMILLSYNIPVDPLKFALDTYDPYWQIFGVWPRVVQNASEYGIQGTVTRYRTWSQAREVLAKGGRIGMSIGPPLYGGHLVMLAGFTENGDPIVHDPARTYDGYAHVFNKYDLSRSWFAKGGVAYTFFPLDTAAVSPVVIAERAELPAEATFELLSNYPNPFNASTTFRYQLHRSGLVELFIFNLIGERLRRLVQEQQPPGLHQCQWDARDDAGRQLPSGTYFYQLRFDGQETRLRRLLLLR